MSYHCQLISPVACIILKETYNHCQISDSEVVNVNDVVR